MQYLSAGAAAPVALRAAPRDLRLSNFYFHLHLHASADGVWLDELRLNQEGARPNRGFTGNLLASDDAFRSGTALLVEGLPWQASRARLPSDVDSGRSAERGAWLRIGGIELGPESAPLAREEWTFELQGAQLRWHIRRTFLREVRVMADRFPALTFRTAAEIPGFLDTAMSLPGAAAYPLQVPEREWYEVVSPALQQEIHLAPSGLRLESRRSSGFFSYAKVPADGTSRAVSLGIETVDRARGAQVRAVGATEEQSWTLRLDKNTGPAPLVLHLADSGLGDLASSFAAVHNQWMGWMFGNNPASVPILHEMGWYPMIQGIYSGSGETWKALERQLRFFASSGVERNGYVLPRWWMKGYYRVMWGNLMDQIPHFILAMYFHTLHTGDRDFLSAVMPAVDRVARYMLALDGDGDGVVEVPGTSGLDNGGHDCSNWYDIIKFGHKDAYVNVYCVEALRALAEMKAYLGDSDSAARYHAAHRRAVDAFNTVFWDEASGFYMDWIDVREKMPESGRRYFYTDPNLLAIVFGIAPPGRASRIIANLDVHYEKLRRQFNLPREAIYVTPCNMIPVSRLGDLVDHGELGNQKEYPNYENGCAFFHTTGFEIAARALAGQPERAYEVFELAMKRGYADHRFWAAALKWDTAELVSEPLNDALLILWGFLRGCFGVWPNLTEAKLVGRPAHQLEGARHEFRHLGKTLRLSVSGGVTRIE